MNWFDIIKVEDIDFDKDLEAFGQYSEGLDINSKEDFDRFMRKLLGDTIFRGRSPEMKDLVEEKIRINHVRIFEFIKEKLGRKPTEKEIINYITRVIMHEATHAGMGSEQDSMATHQAEYGAYVGQFPESTYLRLAEFVKHPATKRHLFPAELAAAIGIDPHKTYRSMDIVEKVEELLGYVNGVTADMSNGEEKDSTKEELTRLEIKARQEGKPLVREWPMHDSPEAFYRFSLERYGRENKELIDTLARANDIPIPDTEEKMAGAVTTTSSPSMFNRKVIRGKKKRRDD